MKKYRLKVDTPWAEKGTVYEKSYATPLPQSSFSWVDYSRVRDGNKNYGSYFNGDPEDWPHLFELIEEKSDEERVVEWLKNSFQGYAMNFPASNWFLDTAKQLLAAGVRVEDLK